MKKHIYLLFLLASAQNIVCMDNNGQNEPAPETGFGILELAGNVTNWFSNQLSNLDNAFNSEANEEQPVVEDSNTKLVRSLLSGNKDLAQELGTAAQAENPTRFIALLSGMHNLGLRTENAETAQIVRRRLNHLQLERRQTTQELLEKRRVQEQQIHVLRKLYANQDEELSDDETYDNTLKFAQKALTHE